MNLARLAKHLTRLLDILIPRFVTAEMAMQQIGRSSLYDIVCTMDDVGPAETFDGIANITTFNLFGLGLFPRQQGKVRPFVNPHSRVKP